MSLGMKYHLPTQMLSHQ